MKQYRITTANIPTTSDDDCYLSPDDPIHELIASQIMGGLGTQFRLDEYRAKNSVPNIECDKGRYQREHDIKPGTPAWFELWFGDKK
jgi:hypothetical protein